MTDHYRSALRLHEYLTAKYWDGQAIVGPDPGVRFNYRIGRFIKSYVPGLAGNDSLYYLQAQGYWVLGNWRLFKETGDGAYRDLAIRASASMLERQRSDGAWEYPNSEWKGRIATAEGTWGTLGLLETYRQTAEPRFLSGILRWHNYLLEAVGFQHAGDELAVNYFSHRQGARVPNNTAFVLRFFAELADVTGEQNHLNLCTGLLTFLRRAQELDGELPYAVVGVDGSEGRSHFQCYQYNAFQCLDLTEYYKLTKDAAAVPLIVKLLAYLKTGLGRDGHAFYACGNRRRAVTYHAAALGAAFAQADRAGVARCSTWAERAYAYVLGLQRPDGSFVYSRRDYGFLSDKLSYPRQLAMILYHLQLGYPLRNNETSEKETAPLGTLQ